MSKIGIYGGSFDPIHHGHLILAEWVRDELGLQKIIFIPSAQHPFKNGKVITPGELRFRMVQKAIDPYPYFEISRVELDRAGISYTVDTLKQLRRIDSLQNAELYYLIGMDNLNDFHLWKAPDEILKLCQLVALRRPGYDKEKPQNKYWQQAIILDSPLLEISATMIRERRRAGKSIRSMVPPAVYELIEQHHLYADEKSI